MVVSVERDGAVAARSALERTIAAGGLVVFPSDGVYGLACDPLDAAAIARVHRLKGRDDGKPSAVMYLSPLALRELIAPAPADVPPIGGHYGYSIGGTSRGGLGPRTAAAVGALLPGPATLIVANPERRYPLACRDDPERLGIRLIDGPLAGAMCPLFQTSANLSGEPPPARFEDVPGSIVAGADLAIDGGTLPGVASTVVDISRLDENGEWEVLREGALSASDVASALTDLCR